MQRSTKINIALCIVFIALGWTLHSIYDDYFTRQDGSPAITGQAILEEVEVPSPSDKITKEQIKVYEDRVVVEIENAEWSEFTQSKSMHPLLNEHSNALEIVPKTEAQIKLGDLVAYQSKLYGASFLHRVIDIGEDDRGTYYIMKGDNNKETDWEKVRFEQIEAVVIAIVY